MLFFLCLLLPSVMNGEEALQLAPATITATRSTAPIEQQPYAIYRHTSEEIDYSIGRTNLDKINYGPGIMIQRTAPSQASPFIRGLTGEQSLLLFDGVRLSHAMMRGGPNQYAAMVPNHGVASIDAILGSSSVVQGSDGLTGAIDFRLAPAGGYGETMSPWVKMKADLANGSSMGLGVDSGYQESGWAYSFDASFEDYHNRIGGKEASDRIMNFVGGQREIPNTAYDQYSLGARLSYDGAKDHRYEINFGKITQNDTPRPDGYAENSFDASKVFRLYDEQSFSYVHLRDRWQLDQSWAQNVTTTLAYHLHEESQRRLDRTGARFRTYNDEIASTSLDIEFQSGFGPHALTWGATLIEEETSNTASDNTKAGGVGTSTVPDGSEYNSLGLYVQNDHDLGGGWNLLYGLRYSQYDWSFTGGSGDTSDLTWNLRAQYFLSEGSRVFAGVSRAFRAPNLVNLSGIQDRGSNNTVVKGNPNLEAETSITAELGYNYGDADKNVAITLFNTELDDVIQRYVRQIGAGNFFDNIDSSTIYGGEFDGSVKLAGNDKSSWSAKAFTTASYVRATKDILIDGVGMLEDNLSRSNRLYGKSGVTFEHRNGFKGLVQVRWHDTYDKVESYPVGSADDDDDRLIVPGDVTGAMPGYAVYDVRLDWHSEDGKQKWALGVENISNKTYRVVGSGADGAGRNAFVEVSLRY